MGCWRLAWQAPGEPAFSAVPAWRGLPGALHAPRVLLDCRPPRPRPAAPQLSPTRVFARPSGPSGTLVAFGAADRPALVTWDKELAPAGPVVVPPTLVVGNGGVQVKGAVTVNGTLAALGASQCERATGGHGFPPAGQRLLFVSAAVYGRSAGRACRRTLPSSHLSLPLSAVGGDVKIGADRVGQRRSLVVSGSATLGSLRVRGNALGERGGRLAWAGARGRQAGGCEARRAASQPPPPSRPARRC